MNASNILRQRRARGWLDDNFGDHWDRSDVDGHYFAMVSMVKDEMVTANTIEELCVKCAELIGDSFRP
jgi:hypothetical protein